MQKTGRFKVTHGAGFMVDPRQHSVHGMSHEAFGHTGLAGMTVAFVDPVSRLTLALHTNSITLDPLTPIPFS